MHDATMIELIGTLDATYITVHQERCAMVRNRNANCLRCAEVCTSGCISFDGEELKVSPERCIGCGTCATACPTCALEAHHPNDAQLMNQCISALRGEGRVCIACAQALAQAGGEGALAQRAVRVECLGRVEESLLTSLVAEGVREVALVRHACEACEHNNGWRMVQAICDTERTLLDAWGTQLNVTFARELPAWALKSAKGNASHTQTEEHARKGASPVSATQPAAKAIAPLDAAQLGAAHLTSAQPTAVQPTPTYQKVMADGTLPHFLPDRRERLLDALASLGEPKDVTLETRLWGRVSIDPETCTSCQMCATFCPTGAIAKFKDEDGTFGIEHYAGDCVKCRSCEAICFGRALRVHDSINAKDLMEGTVERFEMKPLAVKRSDAHTIWHMAEAFTNTAHIYER